jgi:hypothetical protein
MTARDDIRAVVDAMPLHIDARRWDQFATLFAPHVRLDYTSHGSRGVATS